MVRNSVVALLKLGYKIDLLLPEGSYSYNLMQACFGKNRNVALFSVSTLNRFFLKFNFNLNGHISNLIKNSDIVFVHSPIVISAIKRIDERSIVFAYNHTDKIKNFRMLSKADKVLSVNSTFTLKFNNLYNLKKAVNLGNAIINLPDCCKFKSIKNNIVIGTLGRMVEKKGFDLLIKACNKSDKFTLIIGGEGPMKKSLVNIAGKNNKNIKFLGWVNNLDVFFKSIDVFCLPSRIEPFGMVLIEAMARGIPVVSTNCDGPRDIIINKKDGVLINDHSPGGIFDALEYLRNDFNMRKKLASAGRKKVIDKYTIDIYSEKLNGIIGKYYTDNKLPR